MVLLHPGPGESPPADSPLSASQSQVGDSDDGVVADVGRKMEEFVHLLAKLKESVTELGEDVARIKAEAKDVHEKIKAEAERAAPMDSMGCKIWQSLIERATVGAAAITDRGVGESCFIAIALFLGAVLVGKGKK